MRFPGSGFILVFLALLQLPLYALTGHEALVIRIASGLVVVAYLSEIIAPRFEMGELAGTKLARECSRRLSIRAGIPCQHLRGSDRTPGTCALVAASSSSESLRACLAPFRAAGRRRLSAARAAP